MVAHPIITGCLLGLSAALCLLCSIGVAVMSDAFQRMQYATPVVSLAALLVVIAVWIEDSQWQSRIKALLVALVLFLMNAILTHATARAVRLRKAGHWQVTSDEHIPLVKDHGEVQGGTAMRPEHP